MTPLQVVILMEKRAERFQIMFGEGSAKSEPSFFNEPKDESAKEKFFAQMGIGYKTESKEKLK